MEITFHSPMDFPFTGFTFIYLRVNVVRVAEGPTYLSKGLEGAKYHTLRGTQLTQLSGRFGYKRHTYSPINFTFTLTH